MGADILTLRPFISHLLLLLLLSSSLHPSSAALCNKSDKTALLAIKGAFNNAYHFASWTPDTGCCDWYDIQCDSSGRVTELSIFADANVFGTIPPYVGDLPFLQYLAFHKLPGVVGSIPANIATLSRLRFLIISWTNVTGPVPSFLASLTALEQLDLSFNSLSGSIPPSLGNAPSLYSIDISRNKLTGEIPGTLFQFVKNAYLMLSHNQLTGPIPKSFGGFDFTEIDLSRNQLIGDASLLFGRSKGLQQIDLSRNQLEFDLTGVEFPENLTLVDLNHNAIMGSIPPQIVNVSNLQFFNVSYNRLCAPYRLVGGWGSSINTASSTTSVYVELRSLPASDCVLFVMLSICLLAVNNQGTSNKDGSESE